MIKLPVLDRLVEESSPLWREESIIKIQDGLSD
jgi:hypothetical protein